MAAKNNLGIPVATTRGATTRIYMPTYAGQPTEFKREKPLPIENDGFTFGTVYANDLAKPHFAQINPVFPVGSMIVREKRLKIEDEKPQTIIAMVKREKGFNKKTNDWEFFMFDGADLTLKKRETKGDCAKCHSQVKDSDFVFKTYLK